MKLLVELTLLLIGCNIILPTQPKQQGFPVRSLREQLERNIFSSWFLYAVRLGIAFFFVPYITSVLGDQRYGVWVIALQSITYLSLFDFGLERALVRLISQALGLEDMVKVNRLVNTATILYAVIGFVVLLAAWLVSTYGIELFRIDNPIVAADGRQAMLILGAYLALRFWLFPFANSLGAFQRYDVSNRFQMLEEVARTALMALALSYGSSLAMLAAIILGVSAVRSVASIAWLRRAFQGVAFRPQTADGEAARELWDYGKTAFGITALWMVIFNSDAILLGIFSSAASAGVFSPAAQVINQSRNLINAVATPLTATVSHLEARGDQAAVRNAYLRGLAYLTYFAVVLMVGIIAFADPFVRLWLRPEFAESSSVMAILAIGSAVFIPQIVGNSILFGTSRHKYLLRVLMAEAILKLILSFLLIPQFGPRGMALATTIPQVVLYATVFPYYLSKVLSISVWNTVTLSIRMSFLAVVMTGIPALVVRYMFPTDAWVSLIGGMLLVGLTSALGGWIVLTPADRARIRSRLPI